MSHLHADDPIRSLSGLVEGVAASPVHGFSKEPQEVVRLVAGLGVAGDAHAGVTVQHRSRVRRDPTQPNLRQVHLVSGELLDQLVADGFHVAPGGIGENVTTRGVDLLDLPTGTLLRLGDDAVVEVTGLRNPCLQLDRFHDGLMAAVLDRDENGELIRKAGVMGVVRVSGDVRPGDAVRVEMPLGHPEPLRPV